MKNTILSMGLVILLAACAPFGAIRDTTEYEHYVTTTLLATRAANFCGTDSEQSSIQVIKTEIDFLEIYTKYIPNNNESHEIALLLQTQVAELSTRSQHSMSTYYCREKLDIIVQGSTRAMKAVIQKRVN